MSKAQRIVAINHTDVFLIVFAKLIWNPYEYQITILVLQSLS